jgi:hypothetical protein
VARHNKKRNVGLIYELLIHRLSKAVVENDKKTIETVNNIIQNRFKKGSELYKEFRLFNAIVKTSDMTEQLSFRILNEAKKASVDHDPVRLDREKSLLIKDINHKLNESNFYDTKISNYPVLASAQQLFNNWRSSEIPNISEVAKHESTVHRWLMREASEKNIRDQKTPGVNDLTFQLMQEKFESKYGNSLTDTQSRILKLYCEGSENELLTEIEAVKQSVGKQVKKYSQKSVDKFLLEKVSKAHNVISESEFSCNAEAISRVMLLDQLASELEGMSNV